MKNETWDHFGDNQAANLVIYSALCFLLWEGRKWRMRCRNTWRRMPDGCGSGSGVGWYCMVGEGFLVQGGCWRARVDMVDVVNYGWSCWLFGIWKEDAYFGCILSIRTGEGELSAAADDGFKTWFCMILLDPLLPSSQHQVSAARSASGRRIFALLDPSGSVRCSRTRFSGRCPTATESRGRWIRRSACRRSWLATFAKRCRIRRSSPTWKKSWEKWISPGWPIKIQPIIRRLRRQRRFTCWASMEIPRLQASVCCSRLAGGTGKESCNRKKHEETTQLRQDLQLFAQLIPIFGRTFQHFSTHVAIRFFHDVSKTFRNTFVKFSRHFTVPLVTLKRWNSGSDGHPGVQRQARRGHPEAEEPRRPIRKRPDLNLEIRISIDLDSVHVYIYSYVLQYIHITFMLHYHVDIL